MMISHMSKKCAARVILDAPPDAPSLPLFSELGWLTVFDRVEFNEGILLYKALHNMCPEYITDIYICLNFGRLRLVCGPRQISRSLFQNTITNFSKNLFSILEQLYGIISL